MKDQRKVFCQITFIASLTCLMFYGVWYAQPHSFLPIQVIALGRVASVSCYGTERTRYLAACMGVSQPLSISAATQSALQPLNFTTRGDFSFPHPTAFLRVEEILQSDWVQQLKRHLANIYPSQTVTITLATESFLPNLLNWLISASLVADPPLEYVITVALDKPVYRLLSLKHLPVILVPLESVLKPGRSRINSIWMARFAVIRLLNYWGYNVQQFDTDAVILRNPKPLYDKYPDSEIVSARGKMPFELGRGPWGFTVCMGAVLVRSTKRMGKC